MWFRLELNKDGSVASCMEVEQRSCNGRHVVYVDAETRTGAIAVGLELYRAYLARQRGLVAERRENRRKKHQCRTCGRKHEGPRNPHRPAFDCKKCVARKTELRSGVAEPHEGRARQGSALKRDAWREALAVFDRSTPSEFRAWLLLKIDDEQPTFLSSVLGQHL